MRLGVRSALVEGAWVAGDVEVVDGRIAAVGCAPRGSAGVAAPGFVDCQVNGFAGVDLRTAATGDYAAVTAALAATGVTTFLPTLHSSTLEMYRAALAVLGEVRAAPPPGARVGGAHLEGPFLSVRWRGAHDPRLLTEPDPDVVSSLLAAGPVALVTLAPELQGAHPLIAALRAAGVVVSVGHTDATAAQTHAGIDAGASMITHCFNAHRRFTPRDPGPAAVALTRPEVTVGLIADLHHVAADAIVMCFAAASGRVALGSDAIAPAGTAATDWLGVRIDGNRASLPDGTLAGAVTPMDRCVRNVISLGIDPIDALGAASTTPARVAGVDARLAPGSPADVVVLDEGWQVVRTLVGGRAVGGRGS